MSISTRLQPALRHLWIHWVKPFAVAAAVVLPFKSAIADWNWVPTGSMKPTILEGDLVLVNKLAYDLKVPLTLARLASWDDPKKGDIVIFFSPQDDTRLVKRVIAGPGDAVEMRGNVLFINDRELDYRIAAGHPFAPEIHEDRHPVLAQESGPGGTHWVMALPSRPAARSFSRTVVPAGQYFMMGDSRDNSLDSRVFGFVDRKQIVGRAERVLLSFDKNRHLTPRLTRTISTFAR